MLSVTVPNSRLEFGGVFSPSTDPPSAKPDGVPTTCKARSCSKTTPNPLHSTENSEEPKCLPGVHGIRRHGSSGGVDPAPGSELLVAWMVAGTTLGQKASELSKTTVFGLMLEQLQFPAPNRNRSQTDLKFEPRTRTWGLTTERIPKWNRRGQSNEYKAALFGLFSVLFPWFTF